MIRTQGTVEHRPKKGGRRGHERKPIIAHHGRQRAGFCGVGVKGGPDTQREGQHHVDHQPKRMEGGQHGKHAVAGLEVQHLHNIAGIGKQVGVAERHGLGLGF